MRFSKGSMRSSAAGTSFRLSFLPAMALTSMLSLSLCISAQAENNTAAKQDKNAPRQIAVSIPGLGEAKIVVTPPPKSKSANGNVSGKPVNQNLGGSATLTNKPIISSGLEPGSSVSVKLPKNMDEFVDDMEGVGKQVQRAAQGGMAELSKLVHWITIYFKQFTHQPSLTPGAYPYIEVPSQSPLKANTPHKLYLQTDGRLKTVVTQ